MSVANMRKCHWPQIKGINLGMLYDMVAANPIVDAHTLSEMVTDGKL